MAISDTLDSLIDYPTDFPIKVMGKRAPGFTETVVALVKQHAPDFKAETIEVRPSKQGTYLSLTITVRATSREQLDALYSALSGHPMVSVVL